MNKIVAIRKFLGLTQKQLSEILRIKQNTISLIENEKINLTRSNKQLLIERLGVNPQWLEEGTGDIIIGRTQIPQEIPTLTPAQQNVVKHGSRAASQPAIYTTSSPGCTISSSPENTGVPYYDKPVTGSILESFSDMDNLEPEYYINIAPLNSCSFYRPVYGESMSPRYNPGDIIACEKIHNKKMIMYGEVYLCMIKSDADYYETIKVLRKNPNPAMITLKPLNSDYDEMTIPLDNIVQLFIIRGKIERNI